MFAETMPSAPSGRSAHLTGGSIIMFNGVSALDPRHQNTSANAKSCVLDGRSAHPAGGGEVSIKSVSLGYCRKCAMLYPSQAGNALKLSPKYKAQGAGPAVEAEEYRTA